MFLRSLNSSSFIRLVNRYISRKPTIMNRKVHAMYDSAWGPVVSTIMAGVMGARRQHRVMAAKRIMYF